MDVFALRDGLIEQYRAYVQGFVKVREPRTQDFVDGYFSGGRLWPEPLVQLNPSFQPGRSVDELVQTGVLHRDCAQIFRRREHPGDIGRPVRLHQHQDAAIAAAQTGESYVLTTGTGSGKSLAYFVPIVDHILRAGAGKGIKAIVVYPMNALCNSQAQALEQFLNWGFPGGVGPLRFNRYTGQERDEQRQAIIAQPPDILLTNFVMLELILTRGDERALVDACQGLEFVVLDELHTYRGRQGADVAMLVRRLRERCGAPSMRCVGTSATLAGSVSREERQVEVARVASRLFGVTVPPPNVIGETLRRATQGDDPTPDALAAALQPPVSYPNDYALLARQPLAMWAEQAFGLVRDAVGRYERREPRTLSAVATALSELTGVPLERCVTHLRELLLAGYRAGDPATGFPLFAFRLHQFVSRGDTVYA
ncbi:MAG TPA: DEAD/DEAH box helicase, partial [Chloroflexota bacterium]